MADQHASAPIVIAGGGLAGLSAALALVERGWPVQLFERRGFLGGKAYSFYDTKLGQTIDNGQHVILRCCTAYLRLLDRLGVRDRLYLQPRLRLPVADRQGRLAWLARNGWPAPFHLLPAFWRYRHLSWREKLHALRALAALSRLDLDRTPALDAQTFYAWLRAQGQSERAIEALWNPFVLPTLNDDVRRVSAWQAIQVFQEAFFRTADAADFGYSRVGLSDLFTAEIVARIEAGGGTVACQTPVASVQVVDRRVTGVCLAGGTFVAARAVILALTPGRTLELLPAEVRNHPFFQPIGQLGYSPIVNVHLWYDRPVLPEPVMGFIDSPAQWVFDRNAIEGVAGPPYHVAISISGAHAWASQSKTALRDTLVAELAALLPAARAARVVQWRVIKELEATFTPAPGQRAARRPVRTPVAGLYLAGAWTATDWPATMEGAIRSGEVAARAVINDAVQDRLA